jgi:hypothetical protein
MGRYRNYYWEFKLQMLQLLEQGNQSLPNQQGSSRDPQFVVRRARSCIESEEKQLLCPLKPFKAHQKLIDRTIPTNRLPIWSGSVRPSRRVVKPLQAMAIVGSLKRWRVAEGKPRLDKNKRGMSGVPFL